MVFPNLTDPMTTRTTKDAPQPTQRNDALFKQLSRNADSWDSSIHTHLRKREKKSTGIGELRRASYAQKPPLPTPAWTRQHSHTGALLGQAFPLEAEFNDVFTSQTATVTPDSTHEHSLFS